MTALAFALVLGVPFAAGAALMAMPIRRTVRIVIALFPLVLFIVAVEGGVFWLGDIGGFFITGLSLLAWLLGVGLSRDLRSFIRFVGRHA